MAFVREDWAPYHVNECEAHCRRCGRATRLRFTEGRDYECSDADRCAKPRLRWL